MQELTLKLTVDQTNVVLEALGNMPFQKVYQIIQTIQEQASHQLQGEEDAVAGKSKPTK
ncbi:MAG: hypothetical protein AAFQ98_21555 [Bacteroidota bacterium]